MVTRSLSFLFYPDPILLFHHGSSCSFLSGDMISLCLPLSLFSPPCSQPFTVDHNLGPQLVLGFLHLAYMFCFVFFLFYSIHTLTSLGCCPLSPLALQPNYFAIFLLSLLLFFSYRTFIVVSIITCLYVVRKVATKCSVPQFSFIVSQIIFLAKNPVLPFQNPPEYLRTKLGFLYSGRN